ncbi:MAG: ATP-binding cassette domain-containing protein [Patescibacteria group bacterium]
MITAHKLTKKYHNHLALDQIDFEVKKGEILGFLGPNGAGKSTTMKIITGFISPTSGQVMIDNQDIQKHSLAVRQKIGYLPENNPLYEDMKVKEYLKFIADMRGTKKDKIIAMSQVCGLTDVLENSISELSKGYRQRVGLASAMMHNPEILILDEPTSGLDPNQIAQIRELIKKIGQEKTVILSTHILPEVEATCDRVIIINRGKIVAQGTIAEIRAKSQTQEEIFFVMNNESQKIITEISSWPMVKKAFKSDDGYKVQYDSGTDIREKIFDCIVENNLKLLTLQQKKVNLEDVFRELTTKEL